MKKTFRPKRLIAVWFVRCPQNPADKDSSWQPSLYPHIYHVCSTCKIDVHHEHYDERTHELRQCGVTRQRGETVDAAMDRLYANPTQYLIKEKS